MGDFSRRILLQEFLTDFSSMDFCARLLLMGGKTSSNSLDRERNMYLTFLRPISCTHLSPRRSQIQIAGHPGHTLLETAERGAELKVSGSLHKRFIFRLFLSSSLGAHSKLQKCTKIHSTMVVLSCNQR